MTAANLTAEIVRTIRANARRSSTRNACNTVLAGVTWRDERTERNAKARYRRAERIVLLAANCSADQAW